MGVKISALPIIATPAMSDVFPVVQAGVTYKESFTQLSSLFATSGANSNITSLTGLTTPLSSAQGGTGVDNASNTLTLAGPLVTTGAFTATLTFTGATSVIFPTSGTLATTGSASGTVSSGLINQLAYYAASGTTVSGLATSASKILVTNGSSVPGLSSTLPAFLMGGTVSTNGQTITNSLTNGNLSFTTNGAGLFELNATQGVNGISNDAFLTADSATLIPTQAAVKAYVDAVAGAGFTVIASAVAAQTTNFSGVYANGAAGVGATITQSVAATVIVDGVTLTLNQRVLFTGQTSALENGLYQISTLGTGAVQAIFTRVTDYDEPSEITPGTLIPVTQGTIYGGSIWLETQTVAAVGTDPIEFVVFAQPSNTYVTLATSQNITGVKSFNSGSLILKGSGSGTSVLNAAAVAGATTFTLPTTTDTLVGVAATQTLTNKTMTGVANTFSAIPYASLANNTIGGSPTWDLAGVPSVVTPGTSGYVWTSNGIGAIPTWQASASGTVSPTQQIFDAAGSGTYTTPTSPAPLYIKVQMVGAGGGGGGGGVIGANNGVAGGSTTFGTSLLACSGGALGSPGGYGGAGGAATITIPAYGFVMTGSSGSPGTFMNTDSTGSSWAIVGGNGGPSFFGGSGSGGVNGGTGIAGTQNSGSGGGGGGRAGTTLASNTGSGGGSGGYLEAYIDSPSATYSYTVGTGGAGGPNASYGGTGGAGANGIIIVTEFYQ